MTAHENRRTVGVAPAAAAAAHRRLLVALEAVFPVRFTDTHSASRVLDGQVAIGEEPADNAGAIPTIVFASDVRAGAVRPDVRLVSHPSVDRRIWETVLGKQCVAAERRINSPSRPLALTGDDALWIRTNGLRTADHVAVPLPELTGSTTLFEALHGPHALALIALVHFLRGLGPKQWSAPGLRSAFVFDDPNLRRRRYGYIDYRELIANADEHCYHAAMAMVPLDARSWNPEVVAMFRHRPDRLSLVMHGNNHSADELMSSPDLPAALALGAQALRRIQWFETTAGVAVDRVMMPPHAVWSRIGARALGALAYDGLCSLHSHPTTEPEPPPGMLAGWRSAEFIDGCAVLPRVPLTLDHTGLALRAFLDQPLILYGHHTDLASGLEPLAAAAARVNGLGDVRWCSVGEIAQTNNAARSHDGVVEVRPGGQRMRISIPDDAGRLIVHPPDGGAHELCGWSVEGADGGMQALGESAAVCPGELIVRVHSMWASDPRGVRSPPRSLPAVVRRKLSESRDRLAPVRARLIERTP